MNAAQADVHQFATFVVRARELLDAEGQRNVESFRAFLVRTRELLIPRLVPTVDRLSAGLRWLEPLLLPHDVLDVAGLAWKEDPYTELIAWALNPHTHREASLAIQRAWLRHVGIPGAEAIREAALPRTQVHTAAGRPDLVLVYPDLVVVVEAKTGTDEHETPTGEMQTIAYARHTATHLRLPDNTSTECVFLTLDGSRPANPKAKAATYLDFVFVAAEALPSVELPPDVRHCYATVLTHFFRCAVPQEVNLAQWWRRFLEFKAANDSTSVSGRFLAQLAQLSFLVQGHDND